MTEKTVIDALIDHSRAIFRYNIFLQNIKKFLFLLSRTPDRLPSENRIKDDHKILISETENRIQERKEAFKKLLLPLFKGETYGFENDFYFSSADLESGYIELFKNVRDEIPNKVLFLSDSKDFKKGDIVDFNKCEHVLTELNSTLTSGDLLLKNRFQ